MALTLDKVIEQVMEMTGQDYLTVVDEMIKDRTREMRQLQKEFKLLGMVRRNHEIMASRTFAQTS